MMRLIMRAIGEAAAEPVTLGQLRDHIRLDDNGDDAAVLGFGIAARQWIEQHLGRPIMPQTVRGVCEAWPDKGGLEVAMPVNSVDMISFTDPDQVATEWETGWVARVSQGGVTRIRPAAGGDWPALGDDPVITVNATAGFAPVPEPIATAICKLAGYLNADRDGIGDAGQGFGRLPRDVRELVASWRWRQLA
jgi:uncharacterized phiE125 gp8 family phage protein